jgi:hypothetical protein
VPLYPFRCRSCSYTEDTLTNEPHPCPHCSGLMKRTWTTVQFSPSPFQPHYNYSVGAYVNSQQEFNDVLRRKGDAMSERLGMDTSYAPLHPADFTETKTLGVTEEGLDSTRKLQKDSHVK